MSQGAAWAICLCVTCPHGAGTEGDSSGDGFIFCSSEPVSHYYLDEDDEEPEEEDQEIKDKTLPRWQIWLAVERSRDQRHWRPWRPDKTKKQTEEDCEDPERQACTLPSPLCVRVRMFMIPRREHQVSSPPLLFSTYSSEAGSLPEPRALEF